MNRPLDPPDPPDVLASIRLRRTTARFDSTRPVTSRLIRELLTLALLAPLPLPLQPARYLIVRSPANRRKLRGCTFGDARLTDAPVAIILLGYLEPPRTDLIPLLDLQLAAGLITPDQAKRFRATVPRIWAQLGDPTLAATRAATLAGSTMILAAEGFGLASAWVEAFDRARVRAAFGIPEDHVVVGLIAVGYPLGPLPPCPGRLPLDQVVWAEHFGQPWPDPSHAEEILAPTPSAD